MTDLSLAIVTGLSGSGKTVAIHALEDAGLYCVDNIPVRMLSTLCEWAAGGHEINRVGLVLDTRDPDVPLMLPEVLQGLKQGGVAVKVLFLDCEDEVLIRRFSETRRMHPMSKGGDVAEGILREREALANLPELADVQLDTSGMSVTELREAVGQAFASVGYERRLHVKVMSFGYKLGLPSEADLVFDVRFIPNPFYVHALRPLTGKDEAVSRWVLEAGPTVEFIERVEQLMLFLLPHYLYEGKSYLTLAIGCTGGQHRSVALTEEIARRLKSAGHEIRIKHRDLQR
ncbi:MAG: RNase adapter RapZ [Candidatus Alcyoniella australis]|nr:RNase adapter RapZ [Candidatus Alcyoniella australis]